MTSEKLIKAYAALRRPTLEAREAVKAKIEEEEDEAPIEEQDPNLPELKPGESVPETFQEELDLNNDGVVDGKDASIAGKTLAAVKKKKKSKK